MNKKNTLLSQQQSWQPIILESTVKTKYFFELLDIKSLATRRTRQVQKIFLFQREKGLGRSARQEKCLHMLNQYALSPAPPPFLASTDLMSLTMAQDHFCTNGIYIEKKGTDPLFICALAQSTAINVVHTPNSLLLIDVYWLLIKLDPLSYIVFS